LNQILKRQTAPPFITAQSIKNTKRKHQGLSSAFIDNIELFEYVLIKRWTVEKLPKIAER
jgi:hypothetical protein